MKVDEPAVAYQRTDPTSYRKAQMFDHPKSEVDNMEEEWLRPFTMAELNRRMDEAEAEIEAGEVMTCEEANAESRRLLPWLS